MDNLAFATLKQLNTALVSKQISPQELHTFYQQRFAQFDGTLNTALEIFPQVPESELSQLTPTTSPLAGIPGIVKDNICQKGHITSCASRMLATYKAPYSATAIERLQAAGAYSMGRANMDEFAMGNSTEKSAFMVTRNPWNHAHVPGGTSGGSAAAVAAGLAPWALGSDTGGSIRQPASFCGIVGLKPTYGLVSRYGLIAAASSLDQIGPLTRTVYDNALVLSVIAGHDKRDSTSLPVTPSDYTQTLTGKLPENFTLGVIDNMLNAEGIDADVQQALQESLKAFEKLGARIKRITLPVLDYGIAVYLVINRAEVASNLARFDGVKYGFRSPESDSLSNMYQNTREDAFGMEVRQRILVGNFVLSAGHADQFYTKARLVRDAMHADCLQALKECDVLFMPTAPSGAFKFNAFKNSFHMDLQDYFTVHANLTGLPCISVPCGFTKEQLPVGFQLMGPALSESTLLQAAYAYEQATPWHTMHPQNY